MKYKVTAIVKKWRDRINGNTYHSVRIIDHESGEVLYCPYQYGYGDHYRQTALKAMAENGWIPNKYKEKAIYYERENNYPIIWIEINGLKRDCIANGLDPNMNPQGVTHETI